jgi:hypothetical protein
MCNRKIGRKVGRKVGRKIGRKMRSRKVGDSEIKRKYKIVRCTITTKHTFPLKFG